MASLIKGTKVILHDLEQNGTDDFNQPLYTDRPVEVENVLVCPSESTDITTDLQLYGKKVEYELCIPRKNANVWENRTVEFFGQKWRTVGFPQEYIEGNLPLDWNRKVKVVRYG